jgi:hypothetical protein
MASRNDHYSIAEEEFLSLEKAGIIRRSNSPWASPLHLVPKKDGSWRPCGDYRRLSAVTVPDRYPLSNMQSRNDRMAGCTVFSKIDLVKAYHQIPIAEAVDMNGRFQMQGGKNWFWPKEMNANRFFCDSHWLEIWSNHFYPSMGPNGGSVAMDSEEDIQKTAIATPFGLSKTTFDEDRKNSKCFYYCYSI